MIKRLAAIIFIFLCTSIAWAVLGGTILARTDSSGNSLRGKVQSVWGVPQTQRAPLAEYVLAIPGQVSVDNAKAEPPKQERHMISPSLSEIAVALNLEHRQKGLLWYSTYKVDFRGDYEYKNSGAVGRDVQLSLKFPASQALYDDLQFVVDGRAVAPTAEAERAYVSVNLAPGQTVKLRVSYKSQGLESWRYSFGEKVNTVDNFHLRMTTNFDDIDFPENTLAPGQKQRIAGGWQLDWNYKSLLSGYQIAMAMPEKLQPGPLASEISFFAPVSLFFFFFILFILTTTRSIDLHPMNYFFLAAAFFAFHLLLAYLVDHLDIRLSFLISSVVSVFLVVTYLRIVTGTRFALREAALAQFLYLVMFSSAFFFKGFTGLAITIGSILTLFLVMQMTGKVRWSEKFAGPMPPPLPYTGR